jgi:hypothetical protein
MTHRTTLLLPLLLTALCLLAGASVARAQGGDHRAGLVIRYADGGVQTQCVLFSEPSITGAELLTRSGLQVTMDYSGMGGAVCSIAGKGCAFPTQDCFCRCEGLTCEYWAYYHWTDGWQYSQLGAGGYTVIDGALEGWSWGAGNFSSGVEPPLLTFADVCPALGTTTSTAAGPTTPTATPTSITAATQDDAAPPQVTFEAQATVSDNSSVQASTQPGSTAPHASTNRALPTPTPTPILLAYVGPAASSGRSDARPPSLDGDFASNNAEKPSRNFSLGLLPGYAAYLLTLASLVGAGVWVVQRKASALRKS